MILNASTLASIQKSFKVIFGEAFSRATPLWQQVAMFVPSTGASQDYPWLGAAPALTEWIDERAIGNIKAYKWTVVNKDWANDVGVKRNDIMYDNIGVYKPLIENIGFQAKNHPDTTIFDLFYTGFNTDCYDGQYFFDSDHPRLDGLAAQSNLGSVVLTADNYGAGRSSMMQITNDRGEYLDIIPNLLVVPPQLEGTARDILLSERTSSGATNKWKDTADLLVVPRLSANATSWYLLDTIKPVKPFIFQQSKKPELVSLTKVDSEEVYKRKKFHFGADYSGNAAYGLWQFAYGSHP